MERRFDALFLGMLNFDISVAGFAAEMCSRKQSYVPRIALGTGGDAVNCAAAFQKFGGSAAICGRIGNDLQGRALTDALQRCGVDTHALVIDPQRGTGTVVNLIQGDNEASYVASLGANAAFCDADVPDELLRQAKLVCVNSLFGCGALTADVLRRARACGALTAADTTTPPSDAALSQIAPYLAHLDYFLPSMGEARQLTGENDPVAAAEILRRLGAKNVVIKLGGDGCYYDTETARGHLDGLRIRPVDFTGCGDNFAGAFLAALTSGHEILSCVTAANAAGARAAEVLGAAAPACTLEELDIYSQQHQKGKPQ